MGQINGENKFDKLAGNALSSALADEHYKVLGLTSAASLSEVQSKCKELLKVWHPDLHKDDPEKHAEATKKVQEFKVAYEGILASIKNQTTLETPSSLNQSIDLHSPQPGSSPGLRNQSCSRKPAMVLPASYKRINPHSYSIGLFGGFISIVLCGVAAGIKQNVLAGLFGLLGIGGLFYALIYGLVSLGRCWGILQGTTARTTPAQAVGFLFIPFFNIYWMFIAYAGLATDANKFAEKQGMTKRISFELAVATCILMLIPYLNIISYILLAILFYQIAGVHNEIIDKWGKLKEHPDPSKYSNSMAIVIVVVCFFAMIAVTGILAAIAIPQFSMYRMKGFNSVAVADCKNMKTSLEAYYKDKQTYPSDIGVLETNYKFIPSKDVEVKYDPVCSQMDQCSSYHIFTQHIKGDRNIAATSDNPQVMYKLKTESYDSYKPL